MRGLADHIVSLLSTVSLHCGLGRTAERATLFYGKSMCSYCCEWPLPEMEFGVTQFPLCQLQWMLLDLSSHCFAVVTLGIWSGCMLIVGRICCFHAINGECVVHTVC